MKRRNDMKKWLLLPLAFILLAVELSTAAITTIMGGAVDGTANPLPPAPATGIVIVSGAGAGVFALAINSSGAFVGVTSSGIVRTSPTGAVWTNTTTQPSDAPIVIQYLTNRILTISNSAGTNCIASHSDNGGISWTDVNVIPIANWRCLDGSGASSALKCSGATCYVGLHNSANGHVQIYTTTDSGASWASAIGVDSLVWVNGSSIYSMSTSSTNWLVAPNGVGPDNSPTNIGVYVLNGGITLGNGLCGPTGTYPPKSGTAAVLIGYCNSASVFFDFLTGNSVTFSPNAATGSMGQGFTMTNVQPSTTYVTGQNFTTLNGTIWSSSTGTSFTSFYDSGVNQSLGQFAPTGTSLYVGSNTDRVYKVS